MNIPFSVIPSRSADLIELQAEVEAYRRERGTKYLSLELQSRATQLVIESGISAREVSRVLGVESLTISRWVAIESKGPKCREVSLVSVQRASIGCSLREMSQDRAMLCLPKVLLFNKPITALTSALVCDLLTLPGVIKP